MSVPFRQRNPVTIGAISLAVIAALMVVAFKAGDLPVIGGGDTYYASFTEAMAASYRARSSGEHPGWASGWNRRASRRYAFESCSVVASGATPNVSYALMISLPLARLTLPLVMSSEG